MGMTDLQFKSYIRKLLSRSFHNFFTFFQVNASLAKSLYSVHVMCYK